MRIFAIWKPTWGHNLWPQTSDDMAKKSNNIATPKGVAKSNRVIANCDNLPVVSTIEQMIFTIRGVQVMFDRDLANAFATNPQYKCTTIWLTKKAHNKTGHLTLFKKKEEMSFWQKIWLQRKLKGITLSNGQSAKEYMMGLPEQYRKLVTESILECQQLNYPLNNMEITCKARELSRKRLGII